MNQMTKPPDPGISGIVMAGGRSRRLGRDKALEPLGGQPLIRRVLERVAPVCNETLVVVADQDRGEALPLMKGNRIVVDAHPDTGSLGGIFSGLSAAQEEWGLVVACDMPFINTELLRHMFGLRAGVDAVVPVLAGRLEPTHALYSKVCLDPIERRLKANDLKISNLFPEMNVRYVPEADIQRFDPQCLSCFNVNSPLDLQRAKDLVAQGR